MTTHNHGHSHRYARWMTACIGLLAAGCSQTWEYHALRGVQAEFPALMDAQWSKRRDYTSAEMLSVQPGGAQTLLIARSSRPGVRADVAQMDEEVDRTYVIAADGEPQAGKTYHVTPDSGRVIEGTSFRPAWRPYRGLEGDVTIMSISANKIIAAVRVSGLSLKHSDPERRFSGVHTFQMLSGGEGFLRQAQIQFHGGIAPAGGEEK